MFERRVRIVLGMLVLIALGLLLRAVQVQVAQAAYWKGIAGDTLRRSTLTETTRNTISRIERASNRVSLDHAVRALIVLNCTEAEIAEAFNPLLNRGIQKLRRRAAEPFFPRPREVGEKSGREHRFPRTRALRYRDRTHRFLPDDAEC